MKMAGTGLIEVQDTTIVKALRNGVAVLRKYASLEAGRKRQADAHFHSR